VNAADWRLLRADPFLVRLQPGWLRKPKDTILGADVAGTVEAVGSSVTQFKPGDAVFGDLSECGHGGFAEYVCAPEDTLAVKPPGISFDEAAAVPLAAVTALQGLRDKGGIQPEHKVLINGASGGVGTFAVQLAKTFGAEVTAVCSVSKVEMARSLGADHVIDYTREDFTRSGQYYDIIFSVSGYYPLMAYRRALRPNGRYIMVGGKGAQFFEALVIGPLVSKFGNKKMGALSAKPSQQDLVFLSGLLASGKVKSVIDRRYPLSQTADAIRYVEAGHASGKVVITMEG
jgi:NADPH:quinone reductase-like Zn-dependent oxidoreductase